MVANFFGGARITRWEYKKIVLHELPRKHTDIDLLCAAGEDGWELVAILPNNVAYLKRHIEVPQEVALREERADTKVDARSAEMSSAASARYRDPQTGETWSGRGRMAMWLRRKQEAGEKIEKYRL
jgi:DNA-binding protein H-NS